MEEQQRPGISEAGRRDADLVARTLAGDATAFDDLIRTHERKAVAVASRMLGNLQDGLDVAQDAFLRAYRSLGTLKQPERFGPWLMRIVSNLSLNYRRSRKATSSMPVEDLLTGESLSGSGPGPASTNTPDEAASTAELSERIEQAIAELPEKQRAALVLFAIEGLAQKEVAEVLECSVELVKWNVFQARKKLKKELAEFLLES